jgi:hypothetical protein
VIVAIAAVVVAAVLAKPWDHGAVTTTVETPTAAPATADALPSRPTSGPHAVDIAAGVVADPTWPSTGDPTVLATQTAQQAEGAVPRLAERAGTWGVGSVGVGPRMLRDEPWSDWTPATAEVVAGGPLHVATWPGTDLCAGYPSIYDRPTLVAITTPHDVATDRVFRGWWTNGATIASLAGSVTQVSPPGNGGIGFLERFDQAPWPPGRYEFHVVAGGRTVSLTVCLTRRG